MIHARTFVGRLSKQRLDAYIREFAADTPSHGFPSGSIWGGTPINTLIMAGWCWTIQVDAGRKPR